jgi:GrpB-like predicted nucleotidyltransferase (UPF0157 family)
VQHIGSSAVPGLGGKNILDIQLLVSTKRVAAKTKGKLATLGYVYKKTGGDRYRRYPA